MAKKTKETKPAEAESNTAANEAADLDASAANGAEPVAAEPASEAGRMELDAAALLETVARLEAELVEARQECADISD